jgi:hypothetical protein
VKGRYQSTLEHSSKIQLDGEVEATWDAALGPAGGVGVEFYGELPVSGCLNSIGLSPVNVSHSFSLDAAHEELVLGGSVSWSVNEADVLLCGLSAGHVDGLLVTSAVVGGGLYAGNYEPDPADIPVPGECSQASATTFTCRYAVDMPKLDGAPLLLSAATPSPEGLVISGTVFLGLGGGPPPGDPGPLAEAYDVTQAGGSGYFTGHCGHGPYIQDPYWAKIRTRGEYCDSEFVPESNPLHVYGLQPTWIHVGPISDYSLEFIIGVLFPAAGGMECAEFVPGSNPTVCAKTNYDVFWEDPYNMLATVWTRDGARTVGLRPPDPPADPTQPDWYEILQKAEEFNQCLLPYVPFELPSWEIDPPPDYALHLPGERGDSGKVSLQNLRIEPLTPLADRRGQAYESGVWLGLHAEAVVVVEGRRFTVPVEAPFQVDWEVQRDVRGGTSALVLGRTAGAKIDVGKALPAAYQNAWFDVGFSPGGIVVHGQAH